MKEKDLIEIFDNCLMQMNQGSSLEEVLAKYPDRADELKKLLMLSKSIGESSPPSINNDAIATCLIKVVE